MCKGRQTPEEQLFYRLLLRELRCYASGGAGIFVGNRAVSPEEAVYGCLAKTPWRHTAEMVRDAAGNVVCLRFLAVEAEDFDRDGRLVWQRRPDGDLCADFFAASGADRAIQSNSTEYSKEGGAGMADMEVARKD